MKNLLDLIIKEKRTVFICVSSAFALFLFYFIFIYKPLYSTDAKIFIKDIPQQNIIAEFGGGPLVKSESGYSNPLFNLAQFLKSKNTSVRVYNALKEKQPGDIKKISIDNEDEWHNYLSNNIKTKIIPSTDTLALSLKWINKETAGSTLNELINQFQAENMEMRKAVAINQREYLDKNLLEISNKLTDVRRQIKNYTIANNAVNMDVEKAVLVQSRVELEKEKELTRSKISYYDQKYKELSDQMGFADVKVALRSASIGQDPYLSNLFNNLATSQKKFADLNGTFTENYPGVIAAKHEVKTLQDVIKERQSEAFTNLNIEETDIRGVYGDSSQEIVSQMALAKAEKASLVSQLNGMEKGINNLIKREASLPQKIMGLEELQKQESALKNAYESIKTKQLEARLNENSIVNNIFVLDAPSKPSFVFADLLFKLVGFLYLGVIAGIVIAWLKNFLEGRINVNEMESYAV